MEYLNNFLNWLFEEGKDDKTIKAYRTTIRQFIEWLDGSDIKIAEVKPVDVKEYTSYMRNTLNRKQATINKSIASLKTFFSYLVDTNIVKDNIMTRIKLQKVEQSNNIGQSDVNKWLTKDEQDKFISYVELEKNDFKRTRNLAIIDLMLFAGLRVSEVEALRISDLSINGNISITIRDGKKGKFAMVTLIKGKSKNVRNWLKFRDQIKNDKEVWEQSEFLFVSERTGQMGARAIQKMMDKFAEMAHMRNVTPHRLRHSFCKNLANAGVSIEIICKLARHESIETTRIYIDSSHEEELAALKKM